MDHTTKIAQEDYSDEQAMEDLREFTGKAVMITQSATAGVQGLRDLTGDAAKIAQSAATIAEATAKIWESDARYTAMCARIAARKEMFHEFLSKTFDGRDKAIDALIGQIENGVNQNNTALLLKAMDGLTAIVASNPWPNFDALNRMIDSGETLVFE